MSDRLPPGDFSRIESPITPGIPDVSYAIPGVDGWIELKATDRVRGRPFSQRGERSHGLRASQILWIRKRLWLGSHILIAAAVGRDFAVWPGSIFETFNDSSYDELKASALYWATRRNCRKIPPSLLRPRITP